METIEIFKTNVTDNKTAKAILKKLQKILPEAQINFDLEDSDRILRVAYHTDIKEVVSSFVSGSGYYCNALD